MDADAIRDCIVEALRRGCNAIETLPDAVWNIATERGVIHAHAPVQTMWPAYRDAFWELCTLGVLAPGMNIGNPSFSWVSLTTRGQEYVSTGELLPYDPNGYRRKIEVRHMLDPVERRFVGQALDAFQYQLYDASLVMLGVASEHLVVLLAEAIVSAAPASASTTQRKLNAPIQQLVDHLKGKLDGMDLPQDLARSCLRRG